MKDPAASHPDYKPGDFVDYAGAKYEIAEVTRFPHGVMLGIYDEPPGKHVDYIHPPKPQPT